VKLLLGKFAHHSTEFRHVLVHVISNYFYVIVSVCNGLVCYFF